MNRTKPTVLQSTFRRGWNNLAIVALFSMAINVLMLSGPLYMLQVYDRVLPSNSIETLIAMSVLLLGIYLCVGCLELVRLRILARVGRNLETGVAPALFDASIRQRISNTIGSKSSDFTELSRIRDFLSSNALPAFFDLPWIPIYLLILALLHPVLGWLGLGGAIFLFLIAVLNDWAIRAPSNRLGRQIGISQTIANAGRQNAYALKAMGMVNPIRSRWLAAIGETDIEKSKVADRSASFSTISKTLRFVLQSAALGVGAALVIGGEFSAGAMIAGTILLGRGLAPVDQSIAHWRSLRSAKIAYDRVNRLLLSNPPPEKKLIQPRAHKRLDVERLFAGPPGSKQAVISGIDFSLTTGDALAVLGPSAAGKSTLARLLAGIWTPQTGTIRLDDVALQHLNDDERGSQIGYLPQDVQLIEGSVAENIARFQYDFSDAEIVSAAMAAGAHEMILRLPDGYETNIGEDGTTLSGGQRQRIGLARALFREPFCIILDEPNANLDADGDLALINAVADCRQRGSIVIVMTHRPSIVDAVSHALVLNEGKQRAFGPIDEVLAKTTNLNPVTHKTSLVRPSN